MTSFAKPDIVHKLKEIHPDVSNAKLKEIVDDAFDVMADCLAEGKEVRIQGFGGFKILRSKEREGRNPLTNEKIQIKAKNLVKFVKSKTLQDFVNQ
jgi:nucleoid DNA-binding protein